MSFIRVGSRLGNGTRSGAYIYNDGQFINIVVAHRSAARRKCETWAFITCEELIAVAKATAPLGRNTPGQFLERGARLANGAKSAITVKGDGQLVTVTLAELSAKRRNSHSEVKLTYAELQAVTMSCINRGWVKQPKFVAHKSGSVGFGVIALEPSTSHA